VKGTFYPPVLDAMPLNTKARSKSGGNDNDFGWRSKVSAPVGNGTTVFGTPSIDPGSAWFTRKTGECSPPGVTCLTVGDSKWTNYSVVV
jgi:hypothetical protein